MTICKVWDADYPWDIRVEKIAESLASAGHAVHLVCRNQGRRVRAERNASFSIHRLPALPRALGPLHTVTNFPHPLNPVWLRAIARTVATANADLILARDVVLALPAIVVGMRYRIPVVLDLAENYPAMLQDRLTYTPTGRLGRMVRRPALARVVERLACRFATHVIVVVEESRDRLMAAGVPADRLTVVSNTPRLERWNGEAVGTGPASRPDETTLVYLGNLDGSRGIDVAMRAVAGLRRSGHPVRLEIVGDGPSLRGLRALVAELGLHDGVTVHGRLPFRDVKSVLARSDVGLIPHYSTEAWNTTIPNKLFDYMHLGLPVIVSDARPTVRVVQGAGCGEVFRDRSIEDLERCIRALRDVERRRRLGERGQAAIRARYNWAFDSQILVNTVEAIGRRGSSGRRP